MRRFFVRASRFSPSNSGLHQGFSPRVLELYVEWQRRKLVGCIRCKSQQPRRVGRTSPQISPSRWSESVHSEQHPLPFRTPTIEPLPYCRLVYQRGPRAGSSLHPHGERDRVMVRGCYVSDHLPSSALSSRAELHAVTSTTLLRRRSPLYTSNVGVLPSFKMCSPSESRKSQRSTPRASLRSLPHHTLHALTSPPRMILSVPSFEQTYRTRSRYGPMGMSPSKYTDTTPILQFPALITAAATFSPLRV
ncbi:hypothetical protein EVAR_85573_1 [Eumeta japonica]|uniref:Uncharacterized protein n=1 Tax=Eumeta variegata TaxID=151549 RepID=A0A4C2A831_EUMVA|nr:hypothetical protein EVAR_85573_1 [Eumeta japonica]